MFEKPCAASWQILRWGSFPFNEKIVRCNDFGAGGVCVAVGELAPGLNINLDAVLKKYEGLTGTENQIFQPILFVHKQINDLKLLLKFQQMNFVELHQMV